MDRGICLEHVCLEHYANILEDFAETDNLVRLHVYDGIGDTDTIWTGKIKTTNFDSKSNEGWIAFEHIPSEAKRLQCVRS